MTAESASIAVQWVRAIHGVIISVAGAVGPGDAAVLSRCLHQELGATPEGHPDTGAGGLPPADVVSDGRRRDTAAPRVIVVDLGGVWRCDQSALDVLVVARQRARAVRIRMHILDRGQPLIHQQLVTAGLA